MAPELLRYHHYVVIGHEKHSEEQQPRWQALTDPCIALHFKGVNDTTDAVLTGIILCHTKSFSSVAASDSSAGVGKCNC